MGRGRTPSGGLPALCASTVRVRGRGRGGYSSCGIEAAAAATGGVQGSARGGRRGAATDGFASAAEERSARASDAAVVAGSAPVRRSARLAVRSEVAVAAASVRGRGAGGGRIVCGFGYKILCSER